MKKEIVRALNMKKFFKIKNISGNNATYIFEQPSRILMNNIHYQWLQSVFSKTHRHFPVFISNVKKKDVPYGFIDQSVSISDKDIVTHCLETSYPRKHSLLNVKLFVPKQDIVQSFIQWQRYRKYWWSSITTTPSLFALGDIQNENTRADVSVTANFPWGPIPVETITADDTDIKEVSCLSCSTTLEGAVFVLLFDAMNSSEKENLKFHRRLAPYKISFILQYNDSEYRKTLVDLAKHLHLRLRNKRISSWLPSFLLDKDSQIKENLKLGVPYIAVLTEKSLSNGIFYLLNTSTMLKEQIHVADFDNYANLLFK